MINPFLNARVLWYVSPATVSEASAEAMVAQIRTRAPNVTGILVKAWNWDSWPYRARAGKPRAIAGQADLRYWVELLRQAGLRCFAWGVARGANVQRESDIMRMVADCGVDALVVDVESGPSYFAGTPAAAATLARAAHSTGVHVGLCLDYRGNHPRDSSAVYWMPYVHSLHPMCYHFHFGRTAESVLTEMSARLATYNLPIVPALQGYSVGARHYNPADIVRTARIAMSTRGVVGLSWFRYGLGLSNNEDGIGPDELKFIASIEPVTQTPTEPVLFSFIGRDGQRVDILEARGGQWRLPGAAGWMQAIPLKAA